MDLCARENASTGNRVGLGNAEWKTRQVWLSAKWSRLAQTVQQRTMMRLPIENVQWYSTSTNPVRAITPVD